MNKVDGHSLLALMNKMHAIGKTNLNFINTHVLNNLTYNNLLIFPTLILT